MLVAVAACSHFDMGKSGSQPSAMGKVDADEQAVLTAQQNLGAKPIENLSVAQARKQPSPADGVKQVLKDQGKNPNDSLKVETKDIHIEGLKARVYRPENAVEPLPVIVYYHGGGWVIADLDTYDATPRIMAKETNAIVISVEYRHAPEHKFPAAHEDAFKAYKWVVKNVAKMGGDPKRIAVMGESAGGNLAINVSIKARDTHTPMPVYQALIYPVAGTDMNTPSYIENENAKPLNKPMMKWFVKNVLRDKDKKDPRIDLVDYANLKGLPPTTVITAQIDPLRSEGQELAMKLNEAGVEVDGRTYPGVTHEFFGMGAVVGKAQTAEAVVASDLRHAFGMSW